MKKLLLLLIVVLPLTFAPKAHAQYNKEFLPENIFADNANVAVLVSLTSLQKMEIPPQAFPYIRKAIERDLKAIKLNVVYVFSFEEYNEKGIGKANNQLMEEFKKRQVNHVMGFTFLNVPTKKMFDKGKVTPDRFVAGTIWAMEYNGENLFTADYGPKVTYMKGAQTYPMLITALKKDIALMKKRDEYFKDHMENPFAYGEQKEVTIHEGLPSDLDSENLLVMKAPNGLMGAEMINNKMDKRMKGDYPHQYTLVSDGEIDQYKEKGTKYALLYTIELIQLIKVTRYTDGTFKEIEKIPANHYGFYVKNIQNGDLYITDVKGSMYHYQALQFWLDALNGK